jgi:hypothetical protein
MLAVWPPEAALLLYYLGENARSMTSGSTGMLLSRLPWNPILWIRPLGSMSRSSRRKADRSRFGLDLGIHAIRSVAPMAAFREYIPRSGLTVFGPSILDRRSPSGQIETFLASSQSVGKWRYLPVQIDGSNANSPPRADQRRRYYHHLW